MEKKKAKATKSGCVIVDGAIQYEGLDYKTAQNIAKVINEKGRVDFDYIEQHLSTIPPTPSA